MYGNASRERVETCRNSVVNKNKPHNLQFSKLAGISEDGSALRENLSIHSQYWQLSERKFCWRGSVMRGGRVAETMTR